MVALVAAALSLGGASLATFMLARAAHSALERVQDERLWGAGRSAALLVQGEAIDDRTLTALSAANHLDGAWVLDPALRIRASADGSSGRAADLLRFDPQRVAAALQGHPSVGAGATLGSLPLRTGYFRVEPAAAGEARVLVLEGGEAFAEARAQVNRARRLSLGVALLGALALAALGAVWARQAARRQQMAERAARGEILARLAASAAHEIRNPLGIIRGSIELLRERLGGSLPPRDQQRLTDVLEEVERLKGLTEELMVFAADRPLAQTTLELGAILTEAARATEAAHPEIRIRLELSGPLPVRGDAGRLRQVFVNLLQNAAQAQGKGEVALTGSSRRGEVRIRIADHGPGVAPEVRARLFEPFVTSRAQGTGLGLAVAQRFVVRHGGKLALVPTREGATFEVCLPRCG